MGLLSAAVAGLFAETTIVGFIAPAVLFGIGLPDENAHAPNEKLDLSNFNNGVIATAFLYDEIAKIAR